MDNSVTLAGILAHDPITSKVGGDSDAISCRFTLGIHRVWQDRKTNKEKNYTTYHEIVAYRKLAVNIAESCRQGDSVVVVGRLNNRKRDEGEIGPMSEVIADHVALDLLAGSIPVE